MNLRVRNLVVTCRWKSGRVAASEEARRRLAVPRESVDREDSASSRTRSPRSRLARSGSALEASRLMRDNTAGLWLRGQRLRWPLQKVAHTRWGSRIPRSAGWGRLILQRTTVIHPAHVGAYVFGRTRKERYLDPTGAMRQRSGRLPRDHGRSSSPITGPGSSTAAPTWATMTASASTSSVCTSTSSRPAHAMRDSTDYDA